MRVICYKCLILEGRVTIYGCKLREFQFQIASHLPITNPVVFHIAACGLSRVFDVTRESAIYINHSNIMQLGWDNLKSFG